MKYYILAIGIITLQINSLFAQKTPTNGRWNGYLQLHKNTVLPFQLDISEDTFEVVNNTERILLEVRKGEDSTDLLFPDFNSFLRVKIESENSIHGFWYNRLKGDNYKIPFSAKPHLPLDDVTSVNVSGKWETTFSPQSEDAYKALGVFEQNSNVVTGTFLTETGDYRFLSGTIQNDKLVVSTFNGSFAFLFTATVTENKLEGMFYSGNHWKTNWEALKNENFKLADADSLTYVTNEEIPVKFEFPDLQGNTFSYPNPDFEDKVVIIQLMGSWCPNCLDESLFYKSLYEKYATKGLEIISVCYEIPKSAEQRVEGVKRMKAKNDLPFHFVIAGSAKKDCASKHFPMLNDIMSFPTSIIIDKSGKIRNIHTGFSGPGTGDYYLEYEKNTTQLIEELLSE